MIDLIIFLFLALFYFFRSDSETSQKEATSAMCFYVLYLLAFKVIPPFPEMTSRYDGQLYGFIPLLSLGAILFPHYNTQSPEVVTRILGWMGIILTTAIMLFFKLYVW